MLTIVTGKKLNPVQNVCVAASDHFHMFTQSIKFYRVQMFEKCDSSNKL